MQPPRDVAGSPGGAELEDSEPRPAKMLLRLYLAPGAPNSARALANLHELIQAYLGDGCELELVDVRKEPQRALADDALITPTLLRLWPLPVVKIVGNLSQTSQVLAALGLRA